MVVENPKDDNPEATNFVDNPIADPVSKNDGVILEDKKEDNPPASTENKISMMDPIDSTKEKD